MSNTLILRFSVLIPLVILMILAVGIGLLMSGVSYDLQGLVLVAAILGVVAVFLIPRLAKQESDGYLSKVLVVGLLLKLGFAMVRNWTSFVLYGGTADASFYNNNGALIAQHIWRLDFGDVVPYVRWGTNFMEFFTGVVYSVVGPSILGGYLVYAFLSFLGSYYFYRAFRVAFPQGNTSLFTLLIFFFPSILFWPNGIGKDALIFFCLGLSSYGFALFIGTQLKGLLPMTLGFLGTLFVRPHIAAILGLAIAFTYIIRGGGKRGFRPITFIIGLLVIGGIAWFFFPRIMSYVGLKEFSPQEISNVLQYHSGLTARGGSAFQTMNATNPLSYPWVIVTLLFRPFPWEAHNLLTLIQSMEGILLLGLVLWRIKSLGRAMVSSISNAYLMYILVYTIGFIIIFSAIGNFGILARQRCMLLPLFFMLLAYTPFHARYESKTPKVTI